jgi:hypothetical protein
MPLVCPPDAGESEVRTVSPSEMDLQPVSVTPLERPEEFKDKSYFEPG